MAWYSVKDFAELAGKSRQAVLKAIKAGKYQAREVEGRGRDGKAYEIWVDNLPLTTTDNLPLTTTDNLPLTTTDNLPLTTTDNLPLTTTDNLPLTTCH